MPSERGLREFKDRYQRPRGFEYVGAPRADDGRHAVAFATMPEDPQRSVAR
jgi:hypothetical protein